MSQVSESKEDRWLDLDLAAANMNRAGTLVGSTIAVFTFTGKEEILFPLSLKLQITVFPSSNGPSAPPVVKYLLSFFGLYTASNTSLTGFWIFV